MPCQFLFENALAHHGTHHPHLAPESSRRAMRARRYTSRDSRRGIGGDIERRWEGRRHHSDGLVNCAGVVS